METKKAILFNIPHISKRLFQRNKNKKDSFSDTGQISKLKTDLWRLKISNDPPNENSKTTELNFNLPEAGDDL